MGATRWAYVSLRTKLHTANGNLTQAFSSLYQLFNRGGSEDQAEDLDVRKRKQSDDTGGDDGEKGHKKPKVGLKSKVPSLDRYTQMLQLSGAVDISDCDEYKISMEEPVDCWFSVSTPCAFTTDVGDLEWKYHSWRIPQYPGTVGGRLTSYCGMFLISDFVGRKLRIFAP